jgi:cytoskeletal protein CcmA (bactofilin family)
MESTHVRASRRRRPVLATAAVVLFFLSAGRVLSADEDRYADPVYMTGVEVRIDRAIDGDLVAAAGRIHVDQPIAGDAILGAGSLDIQAPVGEDLRAAGGIVTIANRVKGEVMIAAGRITLSRNAEVQGHAWLAGSSVSIDGRSLSSMKVYGRDVALLGEIYGPLEVSADRVEIRGSARIYGDITYSSDSEITIDPQAQVMGKVTRTATKLERAEPRTNIPGLKPLRPLLLAGLFAAGVLLNALVPDFVRNSVRTLAAAPVKSLGLGSALFFSVPPVAILLILTIIGIPIGLALAAVHAIALVGGYLITGFFMANKLAQPLHRPPRAYGWPLVFLAGALVLLALATSIPYVGPLVLLLALAGGLGAMVLQAFSRYAGAAPTVRSSDAWPGA